MVNESSKTNQRRRLAVCYAVPGHDLLTSAGPTRNVLSLAEAMSQWADVTVAFRRVLDPVRTTRYDVVELEPAARPRTDTVDDAAVFGIRLTEFLSYLGALRRFTAQHAARYDVVLEKSWLLSGYVVSRCRALGVPGVVVENVVRVWNEPLVRPSDMARYARYRVAHALTGHYLRRAALIVAETEELRDALTGQWRIDPRRIQVIGLGVDHGVFRPQDQHEARRGLALNAGATILLYVGALDRIHDLTPVVDAMSHVRAPSLEFHIVGDGRRRDEYAERARRSGSRVRFHGRVPHADVPRYIAAADLCLAPYDITVFPGRRVAYSTLKIPEYFACARPVASVPSGHITRLVSHGVSGFLLANEVAAWVRLLDALPPRARLLQMGHAGTRRAASITWARTAATYVQACEHACAVNLSDRAALHDTDVARAALPTTPAVPATHRPLASTEVNDA